MKNLTKKYKFVGDSSRWGWKVNPVKGETYDEDQLAVMYGNDWYMYGGIGIIVNWDSIVFDEKDSGVWEEVIDKPSVDPLIEKLTNLDQLYSQMIGVVEELWVDLDEGVIEKCGNPKLAFELVMGVYKKHRRLVKVLDGE